MRASRPRDQGLGLLNRKWQFESARACHPPCWLKGGDLLLRPSMLSQKFATELDVGWTPSSAPDPLVRLPITRENGGDNGIANF